MSKYNEQEANNNLY